MNLQNQLKIKRAYEPADEADGFRILVDRLWPRGVRKEVLQADLWEKEITPSPAIRKAFDHQEDRFSEFKAAYREELDHNQAAAAFVALIHEKLQTEPVTLIYAARSETINHAVILRDWLLEHFQ